MSEKVMIVDDEPNILELLEYNLKKEGYEVIRADTGEMAVSLLAQKKPDIVLLDQMLPGLDGLGVLKKIRSADDFNDMPVIMVTAKSEEIDKIIGLELGADDYITKPFSPRELVARVKAQLRRAKRSDVSTNAVQAFKTLKIDAANYKAYIGDDELTLTLKEFELLSMLMANGSQVLTRDLILNKIWGYEYFGETRTVDVHITNLRRKIGEYGDHIETVRGVGYRFNAKE
ncbi:MAG: response regulator transcription factor [Eubacteriales bacterium]|nr:response regulator transcription factor [Eubacteriales bacterium]